MPTSIRIPANAYHVLRDALPAVFWYKASMARFLGDALRDAPDVLVGLQPTARDVPKRKTAELVINRLRDQEQRYQHVIIQLIQDVSSMTDFPEMEKQEEPRRTEILEEAHRQVSRLKPIAAELSRHRTTQEEASQKQEALKKSQEEAIQKKKDLDSLMESFTLLKSQQSNPQQRGRDFESLLHRLFDAFNLDPHAGYPIVGEQIDGSFHFDTDDYLLEAKWTKDKIGSAALSLFNAKVSRKGKNALGLFISISGFTSDAQEKFKENSQFITMDDYELFLVLDGRVSLPDMLRRKKRHANETGSCFGPNPNKYIS